VRYAAAALLGAALVAGCSTGATKQATRGARIVRFSIESPLVRRRLGEIGVVPAGGGRRALVVFLHGRGGSPEKLLSDELFAALARLGKRAPDLLLVDGGSHSYFHDRREGAWGQYVLREAIPNGIRRLHADQRRVAIGGISMGGFGALDLARVSPGRFCAVGGHSAALWATGGQTAAGAFDDAEDFAQHDVIGAAMRSTLYPGARVWLDVGTDDPFRAADTELAHLLRRRGRPVLFHVWPGSHDDTYWKRHVGAYMRFYAGALARCHAG